MDPKAIEETEKFKAIHQAFREYEDAILEDDIRHDENDFVNGWLDEMKLDLLKWLPFHEKYKDPHTITYEFQGETVTREREGYSQMRKFAIIKALNAYAGMPIKEACERMNLNRTFFYEIRDRVKKDDETEDLYFQEREHITRAVDEFVEVAFKLEERALLDLCRQLELLGLHVDDWLQGKDTEEAHTINTIIQAAQNYSNCKNYRDIRLFEHVFVNKMGITAPATIL